MIEHHIKQLEESLARNKEKYAKALYDRESMDIKPVIDLVFNYRKGDSPEHAIFLLAQCQLLLKPFREIIGTIAHYEQELETLNKLKK